MSFLSGSVLYGGSICLFYISLRELNKSLLVKNINLPHVGLNSTIFICSTLFLIKSSNFLLSDI